MKKINIHIIHILFSVSILVISFTSCSVDSYPSNNCSENSLTSRVSEKQVFLSGKSIETKLVFVKDESRSLNYEWSYARGDVVQETMKQFIIDLGLNTNHYQVFYLKLFIPNRQIIKHKNLNLKDIVGFTIYYIDDNNKAFAKIFKKDLTVIGNYHIKTISSATGAYTMYNLLKVPNKQGTIVAINGSTDFNNDKIVWRKNYSKLHQQAKHQYLKMGNNNKLTFRQPECPDDCQDGPEIDCGVEPPSMSCANLFDNDGGICDRENAYYELKGVDSTKIYADSSIVKFGNYYEFRDSVLSNTLKGQNFIDMYYYTDLKVNSWILDRV